MDEIQKQGGLVEMLEQRRYQMRNEKDDKILKKSGLTEMFPATWEEMLQAMEVMATNYDQKSHEAGTRSWEYSTVSNELSQQQSKLISVRAGWMGDQTAGLQSIPIETRNGRYSRRYRSIFESLAHRCPRS